jgi:signal transduction histidine kinase
MITQQYCLETIPSRIEWVMDLSGHVLTLEPSLHATLPSKPAHLKDVLNIFYPRWSEYLPCDWTQTLTPLFFPAREELDAPYGLTLQGLRHQDLIWVSLAPTLNPAHAPLPADLQAYAPYFAHLALKLEMAQNRLHSYTHHFPGVFFSQRPDGSFNTLAQRFSDWIGGSLQPFLKSPTAYLQCIAEDDRGYFLAELRRHTLEKETFSLNYRLRLKNKKILHIFDVRTPQFTPNGILLGYEGVLLDRTRQVIAEEHLRRSAWKENLGILTGGLLHDFSNLMAGIYSVSELYASQIEGDHPWLNGLTQVQRSAKEAQFLVRRILDLHREGDNKPDYFDLKLLIESQKDLLKIVLPKQTVIDYDIEPRDFPVYIDGIRFRQTLLNFALNTRDALLGQAGKICISLSHVAKGDLLGEGFPQYLKATREGAIVAFQDNASGIASEYLAKIFDPFFTTKEATKGSGLGLYNAKLFLESVQGQMGVKSCLGQGTTFYLYLPLTDFSECENSFEAEMERHHMAFYAANHPDELEWVSYLRGQNWEVHETRSPQLLWDYLGHSYQFPDIIFLMELGEDIAFEPLIEGLRRAYPKAKLVGQLLESRGTTYASKTISLLDFILNREHSLSENFKKLSEWLKASKS